MGAVTNETRGPREQGKINKIVVNSLMRPGWQHHRHMYDAESDNNNNSAQFDRCQGDAQHVASKVSTLSIAQR